MKNNRKRTQPGQFEIKTLLTICILAASTLLASAQKSTVVAALTKAGIDQSILDPATLKAPTDYAYDLKESTTTAGKTKVIVAHYNPSASGDEQWTVTSVDGKSPSSSDIKTFRKNKAKPQSTEKTDDASYKIEQETADKLTFSYKMNAATLPKGSEALKDCRLFMTVNPGTKQVEQIKLVNEQPIKLGMLKADKFEMISKFTLNAESKHYFPSTTDLTIESKFLGQPVTVQTTTEYSNYSKK